MMKPADFSVWGWRIRYPVARPLAISIYIRLKPGIPIFQRLKAQGSAQSPIKDSFFKYPNNKYAALALFGATAGQGVVWYTGQFTRSSSQYAEMDWLTAYADCSLLLIGTPFFIVFRALRQIGRLKIILFGCAIAAVTYIRSSRGSRTTQSSLEKYQSPRP